MLLDANARDTEDVPLLHWAAINDRRGIVKYLLKQASNRLRDGALGVPRRNAFVPRLPRLWHTCRFTARRVMFVVLRIYCRYHSDPKYNNRLD